MLKLSNQCRPKIYRTDIKVQNVCRQHFTRHCLRSSDFDLKLDIHVQEISKVLHVVLPCTTRTTLVICQVQYLCDRFVTCTHRSKLNHKAFYFAEF